MSSIGPQLPPSGPKRKRTPDASDRDGNGSSTSSPSKHLRRGPVSANHDEIDLGDEDTDDSDDVGPKVPAPVAGPSIPVSSGPSRPISGPSRPVSGPSRPAAGPTLPPGHGSNTDEIDLASDSDSDVGPAPPTTTNTTNTNHHHREPPPNSDSDSDSDDGYGPALPSASGARAVPMGPALPTTSTAPKRDDWMLAPPPSSTSYTERDTTRMRARKFASKPSTTAGQPTAGVSAIWTETPEEKLRRLQDSVLGRSGPGDGTGADGADGERKRIAEERDRNIAASIEAQRGKSLYEEHQRRGDGAGGRVAKEEEEDDPSKRGFDREKDMALGSKIGTAKRRELVNKSANFGGRFQKGSYL